MKKINYIILLLGVLLFSCKDPFGDEVFAEMEDLPVANYLEAESKSSGEFAIWVDLLKYTNNFIPLNIDIVNPESSQLVGYTCFVPTNAAMQEYLKSANLSSVREIAPATADLLVKYHTVLYTMKKQSDFNSGVLGDSTASGDYLSVEVESGLSNILINSVAKIVKIDIEATNGIIHGIDKVLDPITETIWDKINKPEYSIFAEAVEACGLKTKLSTISELVPDGFGNILLIKNKYTLFAVSNEVFNSEEGITSFTDLVGFLNAGNDYTSEDNALYKYVAYHVLPQMKSYFNLTELGSDASGKKLDVGVISPLYKDGLIGIRNTNSGVLLNSKSGVGTLITSKNINTKNGVIHAVNGILPVTVPERIAFLFEFTDYPELQGLLADIYRKPGVPSSATHLFNQNTTKCYKWETNPSGGSLRYFQARISTTSSAGVVNNPEYADMLNADALRLVLGTMGWVEMDLPTIIEGKYKISLRRFSGNTSGTAGNNGVLTFIIDGASIGSIVANTSGNTDKVGANATYQSVLNASWTFDKTSTHRLRILCGDDAWSNLDYLLFEPIE